MLLNNKKKIITKNINFFFFNYNLIKNLKIIYQLKLNSGIIWDLANLEIGTIQVLQFWTYKSQRKLL